MAFLLFPINAFAYDMPKSRDYMPEEVNEMLSDNGLEEITENGQGLGIGKILSVIKDIALRYLNPSLKIFASGLCCVILTSLFTKISKIGENSSLDNMMRYIETLVLGIILYKLLCEMWDSAKEALDKVNTLMNSMTLCCTTVYAMSGNAASSVISSSQTMIIITVISDICNYGILPVLRLCFGLSFISGINREVNLSSVSEFLRKGYTTLLVSLMTVMSAVMSFQSILSRSADSMAMRTVRLVSGHFVPIVGGFVSEAMSTMASGMTVLKSTIGISGIVALSVTLLSPVVMILLTRTALSLCGAVCDVLGQGTSGRLISGVCSLCNFIVALLCCVGVTFTVNLIIFEKSVSVVI